MTASFTIKIQLGEYFTDQRQNVFILVDPNWNTVSEFERQVARALSIPVTPRFKTTDGYFIPGCQSVEVLRFVDEVIGFSGLSNDSHDAPVGPNTVPTKRKRSAFPDDQTLANGAEPSTDDVEASRCKSMGPPKHKKKKKKDTRLSHQPITMSCPPGLQTPNTNITNTGNQRIVFDEDDVNDADDVQPSTVKKKPAIEIQAVEVLKQADPPQRSSDYFSMNDANGAGGAILNSTVINNNNNNNVADEQPSAFACDAEMANSTVVGEEELEMAVQSMLDATPNVMRAATEPKVAHSVPAANSMEETASMLDDSKLVETTVDSSCVIDVDEEHEEPEEIIDLSDADEPANDFELERNKRPDSLKISEILPLCRNLSKIPNPGDIILFKLTTVDEQYEPTKYIMGKCRYVDREMLAVSLNILDGHEELQRTEKRSLSQKRIENVRVDFVKLIYPKIFNA